MIRAYGPLDAVRRFIIGGSFPAFALWLLLFYELLLVGVLLVPAGSSELAAFAEDFRVWCFGYDPATGHTEWTYVMAMTVPQLMLGSMLVLLWWEPLRALCARPRAMAGHAAAAALVVTAAAAGFGVLVGAGAPKGELPFPAEALRTAHRPPNLALTNHEGEPVALSALRGKVVLVTAMYASCPHTCPLIMAQSKRAVAELSPAERADLRVVAVTLDPERDSPEVLARLAGAHDMQSPLYNLVTGKPEEVERVLDEMGVARTRDPETGLIDHANLFLVIDREGQLAYRFGIGERQERWLSKALRVLLREGLNETPQAG
jgi:protein SCO1/2